MNQLMYGAAIRFPKGVQLKNMPLIQKIPAVEFVPQLDPGTYFTYRNVLTPI